MVMNTYTVSQISEMLDTQEETVRRWIRDGKLKAVKTSNKTGNIVTEEDLNEFLRRTPKYSNVALASLAGAGMIAGYTGIVAAALGAKVLSNSLDNKLSKTNNEKTIKALLKKKISENEVLIEKKHNKIQCLQKEVSELEIKNESLRIYLKNLSMQRYSE